jgi:nucleoside 2-deoxyribosyltransferase
MKAYIAIKYHEDNKNRHKIEKISSTLSQNGFLTCCIVRDIENWGRIDLQSSDLMRVTFEEMDTCDIVVIDLTEKGVGLGIEAGYAYAKDLPIITIASTGSDISKTLRGIATRVILYESAEDLSLRLGETLKDMLPKLTHRTI